MIEISLLANFCTRRTGIVFALSNKGGITNTMVQVVNSDRGVVVDIDSSLESILNG